MQNTGGHFASSTTSTFTSTSCGGPTSRCLPALGDSRTGPRFPFWGLGGRFLLFVCLIISHGGHGLVKMTSFCPLGACECQCCGAVSWMRPGQEAKIWALSTPSTPPSKSGRSVTALCTRQAHGSHTQLGVGSDENARVEVSPRPRDLGLVASPGLGRVHSAPCWTSTDRAWARPKRLASLLDLPCQAPALR